MSWKRSAAIALVGLTACAQKAPPAGEAPSRPTAVAVAHDEPPALKKIATTSPVIALGNLDVQIHGREQAVARDPSDTSAARTLVDLLLARGEFASRIADYERADATAAELARTHPDDADARLAHAATLGTFHAFARQLDELDAASRAHAPAAAVTSARASALMAQGRFDEADALGAWKDTASLDATGLTSAAVLAGERGDLASADRLFEAARAKLRDVSPFALAWMDFQRGALLERRGERARAKAYFAEAHEALPGFAHPAVHLAGMLAPRDALAVLEPLVGQTDDPQVDASYGDVLRRLGRGADAAAPIARARARFEELVRSHPEAFADHAAQFDLGLGHDPARALALARMNAENRRTEPALDLLMTAALAAGTRDEACAAARQGASLPYATAAFRATLDATRAGCSSAP